MTISMLALIQLLFAINFLATKIIMQDVGVFDWGLMRFTGAFIGMATVAALFYRDKFPKLSFEYLLKISGISFLGTLLVQLAFIKGMSLTTATDASIITTMIPVFTLLIVIMRGEEKLTVQKFWGFLIAFIGVLIIQRVEKFSFSSSTIIGNSFMLFSTFCVGLFLSLSKSFFRKNDPIWATVFMFFFATLFTAPLTAFFGNATYSLIFESKLLYYALYSIIGGTIFTYFLNNWCLVRVSAAKVSLFVYLQPIFSAVLAYFFLQESLTWRLFLSTLFIFVGFLLVLEKRDKREDY
jgi:drug/metabolite transporter (DMT)-like permease